jgi:hypothetical protein
LQVRQDLAKEHLSLSLVALLCCRQLQEARSKSKQVQVQLLKQVPAAKADLF